MSDFKQRVNQTLSSVSGLRYSALDLRLNPSGSWRELKDQMDQMILHWIEFGFFGDEEENARFNPFPSIFSEHLVRPSLIEDRNPSDIPEMLTTKLFTETEQENLELLPFAKEMLLNSSRTLAFPGTFKKKLGLNVNREDEKSDSSKDDELNPSQAQERLTQINYFFEKHNTVVNRVLSKKFEKMDRDEEYDEEEYEEEDEGENIKKESIERPSKSTITPSLNTTTTDDKKANANILNSLWNGSGYRPLRQQNPKTVTYSPSSAINSNMPLLSSSTQPLSTSFSSQSSSSSSSFMTKFY